MTSILSDELLRHLIAAGQADILVGVPTYNNATTVGSTVSAVHHAFAKHFRRERTVLFSSDGGSEDGTLEAVRNASLGDSETFIASHILRTIHRIGAPYHGLPGKGNAVRAIFAAAELLQAKAIVVLDPEVTSVTPEWVANLVRPVMREQLDYVAPVYPRHRFDGMLVTQLNRPLVRATYGWRLREPVGGEYACSGRFAAHCLAQDVWDTDLPRFGIDPWLAATAMAGGFRTGQAVLGPRVVVSTLMRPGLPELFQQVIGSLISCLEIHQGYWLVREKSEEVPVLGSEEAPAGAEAEMDPHPLAESFRAGVRDLEPVLEQILSAETLAEIRQAAEVEKRVVHIPDDLWITTVYEFVASHHHGVMHREHLVQALVPLYLGRVSSFVHEHASQGAAEVEQELETLGLRYERSKPYLVERWNNPSGR